MITGLSDQQRRFADGILKGKSQREAYESAGYKARGDSADSKAARLVRNGKVAAYLAEKRQKLEKETEITVERVLRELAIVGFSDHEHYEADARGNLRLAAGVSPHASRAISSIKRKVRTFTDEDGNTEESVEVEYKLWNKNQALDSIGKHLGMFKDGAGAIDVSTWEEPEFLERVARGEDVYQVAADRIRHLTARPVA